MSLTLGLNSAISGLLTNQRALDVISHNVANVNTVGFTRKIFNQESRVLAGKGAGVQVTSIGREIDSGLIRDLRREMTNLGRLDAQNRYFGRMQELFGKPGDNASISHTINTFGTDLELLASTPNKSTNQWAAVRSAEDMAVQFRTMSTNIQALRLDAEQEIAGLVGEVNTQLTGIATLNNQIVRNATLGYDVADLEDKRDMALTKLSEYMDVSYFTRSDNSVVVFASSGTSLIDGSANTLSYSAATSASSGGHFGDLKLSSGQSIPISSGKLKGLMDLRDSTLSGMQAELDELSYQMKTELNRIHNRGTTYPALHSTYSGTRSFIHPETQTISLGGGDVAMSLFGSDGAQAFTTSLNTIMQEAGGAANGPWTVSDVAATMQSWLRSGTGPNLAAATVAVDSGTGKLAINLNSNQYGMAFRDQRTNAFDSKSYASANSSAGVTALDSLTFADSTGVLGSVAFAGTETVQQMADAINGVAGVSASVVQIAGQYRIRVTNDNGRDLIVSNSTATGTAKSNLGFLPSGSAAASDVSIGFNRDAVSTAFQADAADVASAQTALGVTNLAISGLTSARDPVQITTADQGPGTHTRVTVTVGALSDFVDIPNGAASGAYSVTAAGVTVAFDAAGFGAPGVLQGVGPLSVGVNEIPSGTAQETVAGFSNFFGLNDLFTGNDSISVYDSAVLSKGWTAPSSGTLRFADKFGLLGTDISITGGMSLDEIAAAVNATIPQDPVYGSALYSTAYTVPTGGTIAITDAAGATYGPITVTAGEHLSDVAANLDALAGISATVVNDGGRERLRITGDNNLELTISNSSSLTFSKREHVTASVVPEGSGYRLRFAQSNGSDMVMLQTAGSLVSAMGLDRAALGTATTIQVRDDIGGTAEGRGTPANMSRGAVQYDDTKGAFYLSEGDGTTAAEMAARMLSATAFRSAGEMTPVTGTFAEFAATILSNNAVQADRTTDQLAYQVSLTETLEFKVAEVSGVNLDEELSQLMIYQQAYAASAKVISTTQQLFDILNDIIR